MKPRARRVSWPLAAFLAGVFLLKLVVVLQLRDHPLTQPDVGLDTTAYASLARQVLAGDFWLGREAYFVSPLYIYFLAAGLALTDSFTAVRLLQVALGTMAVGFVFVMGREWFGRRAAWIGAALAALTGLFTFYESLILQAALDGFLTSAALTALTMGLLRGPKGLANSTWCLVSGVVFGLATLNRPNMLAGAAGVILLALATRRVRPAALLLAGVVAGMAPVTLRNVVVSHEWSLVSSHGGLNFYIGNGEGATGFYRQVAGISPTIAGQEKDARRLAEQALGRPVTQAETSDYFADLAWAWIRAHPGAALGLFIKKLGYVFHAQHIALPYSFPFYAYDAHTALRFLAIGPWLLIPLGVIGLLVGLLKVVGSVPAHARLGQTPHLFSAYAVWLAFVPAYAAGVAAFFVAERYRLPILIPMLVGAGGAIDALWRVGKDALLRLVTERAPRRLRALAVAGAAFAIIFTLVNWRHGLHDGRWEEGVRMAERLVILGRYDEADAWVKRLEPREPRPGAVRYAVGLQLLVVGQPGRAVPYLSDATARDPGRPEVAYDLARALKDAGDFARAADVARRIAPNEQEGAEGWLRVGRLAAQVRAPGVADPFFQRGVALAPRDPAARQQYGLNLLLLGRLEDAARELTEAVRLDPRDPDSLAHLAYCEFKLGRIPDARGHAEAALAIRPDNDLARQVRAAVR